MLGTYHRLGLDIYASDRAVIRAALKKLKKPTRYNREARELRHVWLREMLGYHKRARDLAGQFRL